MLRNRQALIKQIKASRGQTDLLIIPRLLVDFMGSLDLALLLFAIIAGSEGTADPDGWFSKAYTDWQAELGLSEAEVRRGITKMIGSGFLATESSKTAAGLPAVHYRFEWLRFSVAFMEFLEAKPGRPPGVQGGETAPNFHPETSLRPPGRENGRARAAPPAATLPAPSVLPGPPAVTPAPDLKKAPAIKIYRRITSRWPDKTSWPVIVQTVSSSPNDLAFWEEVIMQFVRGGGNPANVEVMLDFFNRGELPPNQPKD